MARKIVCLKNVFVLSALGLFFGPLSEFSALAQNDVVDMTPEAAEGSEPNPSSLFADDEKYRPLFVAVIALENEVSTVADILNADKLLAEIGDACKQAEACSSLRKRFLAARAKFINKLTPLTNLDSVEDLRARVNELQLLIPRDPRTERAKAKLKRAEQAARAKSLSAATTNYELIDPFEALQALELDVESRFEISEETSTPLRKSIYLKSSEYRDLVNTLKDERRSLIGKKGFIKLSRTLYEYDLERNGFLVEMGLGHDEKGNVEGLYIPGIPLIRWPGDTEVPEDVYESWHAPLEEGGSLGLRSWVYYLPVNKTVALDLENQVVDIYVLFQISGNKKISQIENTWTDAKTSVGVITTKQVKIIVTASESDEIVFSRSY